MDFIWADWLFYFMISWQGDIGFILKPMAVYRIHPSGLYAGGNTEQTAAMRLASYNNFLKIRSYVNMLYPEIYNKGLDSFEKAFYPELTLLNK